jgi:hypothetical protein
MVNFFRNPNSIFFHLKIDGLILIEVMLVGWKVMFVIGNSFLDYWKGFIDNEIDL